MAYQDGHESYAKKLARAFLWARIREYAKSDASALVLAGSRAGDILTAEGLGLDRRKFVAVDRDARVLHRSRVRAPGARYRSGDVGTFALWCKEKFDVVFLDFCSTMTPKLADTFGFCVDRLTNPGAVVGIGFMYGRESPEEMQKVQEIDEVPHIQRFRYAKNLIDAAVQSGRLEYVQLVRYVSTSPNAATTPMLFALMRVRSKTWKKAARRIPFTDFGQGSLLQPAVIEVAEQCGNDTASKVFHLRKSTVASWISEA